MEVQMLQLEDDRNVRADSDRGIEGDDRSCRNIPKGAWWCQRRSWSVAIVARAEAHTHAEAEASGWSRGAQLHMREGGGARVDVEYT
jgi:hypothetical protein